MAATSEADRERLKVQLREAEWWAIHIANCSCSYCERRQRPPIAQTT
jgi:hypothetical protein